METQIYVYNALPREAVLVREEVFIAEQGFDNELDDTDAVSIHIVLFSNGEPVSTCRFFAGEAAGEYIIGRLAVRKPYRSQGLGAATLKAAEDEIRRIGGQVAALHSQQQASPFYAKQGYAVCSPVELEQGCPHVWMKKALAE